VRLYVLHTLHKMTKTIHIVKLYYVSLLRSLLRNTL